MKILFALALLVPASAFADGGAHEITIGSSTRALRTDSANALTEDSLGGGQLGYAHALNLPLVPGVELWATGTFGWGGADGTMFQTMSTELDTLSFTVGGRARYMLRTWLGATARLDLGTARAAVAIRDNADHTAADAGWGAIAQGTVGLELVLLRGSALRTFDLGVRFELGYVAASPISLTATPESGSDGTLQLEMNAAALGSLNLSGKVFAASVSSHF
jgi:hypothetical protein